MHRSATDLAEIIDATSWVDTHEHLVEERHRLSNKGYCFVAPMGGGEVIIPSDWAALIVNYALDDLVSAGLPARDARAVRGGELGPLEKWRLIDPYFGAARHTGYLRAVDLTTERLFGLRLSSETCEAIDHLARELRQPGYYHRVLREIANVEQCQVNSLDHDPFCVSDMPDLLKQDLALYPLVQGRHDAAEHQSAIEVGTLDDYLRVIDWCFDRFATKAVAVKCVWAYERPLTTDILDSPPRSSFRRLRSGEADLGDRRRVEDYLFDRCLRLATEASLPVKLHLGYLAGNGLPPLAWVYDHVPSITRLVQRHPMTRFVLMHMAWPQQEQLLALAKHQPNVTVDLCWAWILAPHATRDFVASFLTAVPANKLLCFGGDYLTVENVVGHAEIARRGLQAALESLVVENWLTLEEAIGLVPKLMSGNANALFERGSAAS